MMKLKKLALVLGLTLVAPAIAFAQGTGSAGGRSGDMGADALAARHAGPADVLVCPPHAKVCVLKPAS